MRPRPTHPTDHRPPRSSWRPILSLAALAFLWIAGFAGTERLPESGYRRLHVAGPPILLADVTSSETHISPADSCDFSGDQVQDFAEIRYRVIWPESLDVTVYADSADGRILGVVQATRRRAPDQNYLVTFTGCLFSGPVGRPLPDGFYHLVVRAIDDTGRVEDTVLPLEIDRRPPVILSSSTNTTILENGDTVVIDLTMDRAGYSVSPNFDRLDTGFDDPGRTTVVDHGDGTYTIRHTLSEDNTKADRAGIAVPITIRDLAGNSLIDRSLFFCLRNNPPELVSSQILSPAGAYRNGDLIRIETRWNSPNTPLAIEVDFGNIDSHYQPQLVTVTERAGNVFELAYRISTANTRPDHPDYRLTVRATDTGCGSAIDTSIVVGLDNTAPPKPAHDVVPATTRSETLLLEGSAPGAFTVHVTRNDVPVDTASPGPDFRFATEVPLLAGPNVIVLESVDPVGNRSEPDTVRVTRQAPGVPQVDAVPPTTRSATLTITGLAPDAVRVDVRRGTTVLDTTRVGEDGRFEINVPLVAGRNVLAVEALNNVGARSSGVAIEIFRLGEAFITVPARFLAGESVFQLGLSRAARSARIELWSLSGDLLQVIEDGASRELYNLTWNGSDSSGRPVNSGPVLSKIDITYMDGSSETVARAFVLVSP